MAYDHEKIKAEGDRFSEVSLETSDGIQLFVNHYRRGYEKVIILAHGWRNAKDTYSFKMLSGMFSQAYDVICFDFRGHGRSGGLFTWTTHEDIDLRAAIDYAKRNRYQKIGVVGFSLGAAISIIEGSKNRDIDSLIAVSPPHDFWKIDYHFWEKDIVADLKIIFGPKGEGRTIRSGNMFLDKIRPIDVVDQISPTPLHLIHGEGDWLIKSYHSRMLYEKAHDPKRITIFSQEGHADIIFDNSPEEFQDVCLEWFEQTLHD